MPYISFSNIYSLLREQMCEISKAQLGYFAELLKFLRINSIQMHSNYIDMDYVLIKRNLYCDVESDKMLLISAASCAVTW